MNKTAFCRTLSISQLNDIEHITSSLNVDSYVFVSLHISEEVDESYVANYQKLCSFIKNHGLHIIADVSKKTKDIFNMSLKEVAEFLSIDIVRIDYGVSIEEIKDISTKFKIGVNASTLQEKELKELLEITPNLVAIHNYYPRPETGLDFSYFDKQNDMFIKYNIPVYCFIKGSTPYRLPIKEGLPTLEEQRDLLPYVSFVKLSKYNKLAGVIVGDPNIDEKQVELINEYINTGIVSLKALINSKDNLYDRIFTSRIDSPSRFIRIKESREYSCFGKSVKPFNSVIRSIGSITIDNDNYSRYSGEIMIVRENLPQDDRVNVIGHIDDDYLPIIKTINGGERFKIIK